MLLECESQKLKKQRCSQFWFCSEGPAVYVPCLRLNKL